MDLERVARQLAAHQPRDPLDILVERRAAVAAIVRRAERGSEVLLLQRAEREGDRWSGHVSMPGGRAEQGDVDLLATAIRETREETAIDLTRGARLLGRLGAIRAIARGKVLPMTITPYVFHLEEDQAIELHAAEAIAHFWLPLGRAARGELDAEYEYELGPISWTLPCWRWEGRTVWGLTYQMLRELVEVVG